MKKFTLLSLIFLTLFACKDDPVVSSSSSNNLIADTDTDTDTNDFVENIVDPDNCVGVTVNSATQLADTIFRYEISGNECMSFTASENARKVELPLIIEDDSYLVNSQLSVSSTVKVFAGERTTFVFDVTNNSVNSYCYFGFNMMALIDDSDEIIIEEDLGYLNGDIGVFSDESATRTCIHSGQSFKFVEVVYEQGDIKDAKNVKIQGFSGLTAQDENFQVSEFGFQSGVNDLSFSLRNNSAYTLYFDASFSKAIFYDSEGYVLGWSFLDSDTSVVNSGDEFMLQDDYYLAMSMISSVELIMDFDLTDPSEDAQALARSAQSKEFDDHLYEEYQQYLNFMKNK